MAITIITTITVSLSAYIQQHVHEYMSLVALSSLIHFQGGDVEV